MIIITNEEQVKNETTIINELFKEGLPLLHIRKPYADKEYIKCFIEGVQPEYHARLVLHQEYDLADEYAITRLHLTEKTRPEFDRIVNNLRKKTDLMFSTSVHSIESFNALAGDYEYAFLSPVYNSISKPGYKGDESIIKSLALRTNSVTKLIALGGIDYKNYIQTIAAGFDGAALLGCIWKADDPVEEFKKKYKTVTQHDR